MFYVYEFSTAAQDYRWIGAYSERAAALAHVQKLQHRGGISCGLTEMDWDSFVECATRQRLGKLADALVKLKLMPSPAQLSAEEITRQTAEVLSSGDMEFPSRAMK